MDKISVIFVNYNSGPFLQEAVENLKCQQSGIEIIVVDNGSYDNSAHFCHREEGVRLLNGGENPGFACAANRGAGAATGDLLLFLNPDALVLSGAVAELAKFLVGNESAGVCGALTLDFHGREQYGGRRRDPTLGRACGKVARLIFPGSRFPTFDLTDEKPFLAPTAVDAVSGACMMVKAQVHRAIGGFDEDYFLHFEDLDYCRRVRVAGWTVIFHPGAPVFHYQGASSGLPALSMLRHKQAGLQRYLRKFRPARSLRSWGEEALLQVLKGVGLALLWLQPQSISRGLCSATRLHTMSRVVSGREPVVLVLGGRSDIGEFFCARLNAAGIATVCISRSPENSRDFPKTVTLHPDFLQRNQVANQLTIKGIVSLCPIWELPSYASALQTPAVCLTPWVIFSSTSVLTHGVSASGRPTGVSARLKEGEDWVTAFRKQAKAQTQIVRPTLVYGGRLNKNINVIRDLGRFFRVVLDLPFGKGLRSPIHADDMGDWCVGLVRKISGPSDSGESLGVVAAQGGEALAFNTLLKRATRASGAGLFSARPGRRLVTLGLLIGGFVPVLRKLPPDFLQRLERDFIFDNHQAARLYPLTVRRFHP